MHARFTFLLFAIFLPHFGFTQPALQFPEKGEAYVIAHRGAHQGIPENSVPAYEEAIRLGCDFVEIDVRTTKDKQLVSIHNASVDQYVMKQTGQVRDLTLKEIRKMDIGEKVGPAWRGTKIPTLDEILILCKKRIKIYLDLKDAEPAAIIELLKKHGLEQQVVWYVSGARHKTIMEIKQECPACLVMPDPGETADIERISVAYNPSVIATDVDHLTVEFVQKTHDLRMLVFADDKTGTHEEWSDMLATGVDGIQTDRPAELLDFIRNNRK
jgi:glycerophosphoryl diester phosphodiesterase